MSFASSQIAKAICDRCNRKYLWKDLRPDSNSPGLMVCNDGCWDEIDPYRLKPLTPDPITMRWARPDTDIGIYSNSDEENPFAILTEDGFSILTEDGQTIEIEH